MSKKNASAAAKEFVEIYREECVRFTGNDEVHSWVFVKRCALAGVDAIVKRINGNDESLWKQVREEIRAFIPPTAKL